MKTQDIIVSMELSTKIFRLLPGEWWESSVESPFPRPPLIFSSTRARLCYLPCLPRHLIILRYSSLENPILNRMNRSGDRYFIFLNSHVFGITMGWYVCVIWSPTVGESPCLNKSLHWPATVKSNGGIDERLCRTDVRYYNFISSEMFQVKLICYVRCFHFYIITPYLLPTYLPH